jgi:hypothetical protein
MTLESSLQRDIELALGAEPDLLLMRNSVGRAVHVDVRTGRSFHVAYGLGKGSPDMVGILKPYGRWFCLELKRPDERPTPEQVKSHAAFRRFGAFVEVVHTVDEAHAALERARKEERNYGHR